MAPTRRRGHGRGLRRRARAGAASGGASATCRRSSGSTTTSPCRRTSLLRGGLRAARRGAREPAWRSSSMTSGSSERTRPARRHAERRLEAAAGARLRHGAPAGDAVPRRADRRRRSGVPAALLGAGSTRCADGHDDLVTTHYMDEAERCQRLAFLSRGQLIAVGTRGGDARALRSADHRGRLHRAAARGTRERSYDAVLRRLRQVAALADALEGVRPAPP